MHFEIFLRIEVIFTQKTGMRETEQKMSIMRGFFLLCGFENDQALFQLISGLAEFRLGNKLECSLVF